MDQVLRKGENNVLRIMRFRRGLSIQAAAEQSGLSYVAVIHAEQGKPLTVHTLKKLAQLYSLPLDVILRNDLEEVERSPFAGGMLSPVQTLCQQPNSTTISGLEYYRKKQRMTQRELAEASGVHVMTISNYEHNGCSGKQYCRGLVKLAMVLNVPVDELLTLRGEEELYAGDRVPFRMTVLNKANPVDRYRVQKNLSLRQLAPRLGLRSGQGAHNVCVRDHPESKYIHALSEYEGISSSEFLIRYGRSTDADCDGMTDQGA